jgi:hypothetical protein
MSAAREELHRRVDELSDDEVAEALRLLQRWRDSGFRPWVPARFAAAPGDRADTAARAEELLDDGFEQ